jgi:hypothetical protein
MLTLREQLGLVSLDPLDLPGSSPSMQEEDNITPTTSRSITPTQANPFPESLTKAHKLLKTQAHVNLFDYVEARTDPERKAGDYSDLVFSSSRAMMRYTRKEQRFIRLEQVKAEWLQPLLRDFGYKRSRA